MAGKKRSPTVAERAPGSAEEKLEEFSPEQLTDFLRQMLAIRRFEERAAQAYGQGAVGGFCHLYIGQEAVAVGALAALNESDRVLTTYRDHGMALARGMSPTECFAELLGREDGCSKGRGGSMHFFDGKRNFLGGHAIVGGHIPLGTGFAFASKYRKEKNVTMCFFGEGAVNNGAFHESLNLAALWELPIVYVCENNRYGMGTPVERASSVYDLHKKAAGYDMQNDQIEGMDVLAVYKSVQMAVRDAREGKPSFLEIRTYRFRGHSMSDPIHSHYRTKEEVEDQRLQDPITRLSHDIESAGLLTSEQIKQLDKEISAEIKASLDEAHKSAEPDPKTVFDFVYKNPPSGSRR